jgi:hypothetical protein
LPKLQNKALQLSNQNLCLKISVGLLSVIAIGETSYIIYDKLLNK